MNRYLVDDGTKGGAETFKNFLKKDGIDQID